MTGVQIYLWRRGTPVTQSRGVSTFLRESFSRKRVLIVFQVSHVSVFKLNPTRTLCIKSKFEHFETQKYIFFFISDVSKFINGGVWPFSAPYPSWPPGAWSMRG